MNLLIALAVFGCPTLAFGFWMYEKFTKKIGER